MNSTLLKRPFRHVRLGLILFIAGTLGLSACAPKPVTTDAGEAMAAMESKPMKTVAEASKMAPSPDPRVGLKAGLFDAGEAIWNMELVSTSPPPKDFLGVTNSDLAFIDNYAIQGNYNGVQIWDITNPAEPVLAREYLCPASQSDVSVYGDLLFISGEGMEGRLDCGTQGVETAVSEDRLRGIRIFDISDILNPQYVSDVQTCRGSHTHSVLKHPGDEDNVYIYVSGSATIRPDAELAGCSNAPISEDPNSAQFRIEVIKVPLANPKAAEIVSSPRIFEDLVAPPEHGPAPDDIAQIEEARAAGKFVAEIGNRSMVIPDRYATMMLKGFMEQQGKEGEPTAADSAAFNEALPMILAQRFGMGGDDGDGPKPGPTQCHDITLYPGIGLAGGACEGYGLLLDISDPVNPVRIDAVADSNFAYWHSATFNNDGSTVIFTDEWGGGGQPKCRASDPKEWGANAIFTLENGKMEFQSYFKLAAAQTREENCVAHNGSLIPVPGRDIMVQAWYQGGISIIDFSNPKNVVEIAYHDRGPVDPDKMVMGGSWSVYWYNGLVVSSEIARGLDIFELVPSDMLTANEIAAAKSVKHAFLNVQGQPTLTWPTTYELAGAYLDQLNRSKGLSMGRIAATRKALASAKAASGKKQKQALAKIASEIAGEAGSSSDAAKVKMLVDVLNKLAA